MLKMDEISRIKFNFNVELINFALNLNMMLFIFVIHKMAAKFETFPGDIANFFTLKFLVHKSF